MQITIGDLGVIYTCLLGITAVVLGDRQSA